MKIILLIFTLFLFPYQTVSQPEFKIKVEDFLWLDNQENYDRVEIMVMLIISNTGNSAGVCEDINNITIGTSNRNYRYGYDLKFESFSGYSAKEIEPNDYISLFIIFNIPKDADDLKLQLTSESGRDSKYLTESFYNWKNNNKDYSKFLTIGQEYFSSGNYFDAIISYQKALIIKPDLKINFQLGNAWIMIGDYDEAIKCYKESIDEEEDKAMVYNNLGYSYFEKNYYDEAIGSFSYAFEIDSKHWDAALGAAISYYESNDYTEAKRCYEIASEIEKRLTKGMSGFENIIEKDGYFYTEKQILSVNKLCRFLGYEYYK